MKTLTLIILLFATAWPAGAVALRFEPQNPVIEVDEELLITVLMDEVVDIRTVELRVSYDPGILLSLDGYAGQLFEDTGCSLWDGFEEEPGSWHGFVVIMDAYCWATGPGELFVWRIKGLAEGYSRIWVDQVRLFDPDGEIIPGTSLPSTYVFVGVDPTGLPGGEPLPTNWSALRALYR